MTTEPGNEGPQPIEFGVASRRESSGVDRFEVPGSTRLRTLRGRARRAMPAVLGSVVILAAAVAVSKIPPPEAPPDTSPQKLSGLVNAPDPAPVALETQEPEDRSTSKKVKKSRKKRPSARKSTRRITFSLGGDDRSVSEGGRSGGSTGSASVPEPAGGGGAKPAKKKPPDKPQATLLLRRTFKEVSGDHFHSVSTSELAAREQRGYEMKEQIGYLFEEKIPGTRLLAIDEGVMGWLYENDQGSKTVPLYRLKGPDYHDYEVILTSSEAVKTRWEGNGWRLDRIEGYVVSP